MEAFLVMGNNLGVKLGIGAGSAFFAKMKQAFSDITDDKILEITNNARISISKTQCPIVKRLKVRHSQMMVRR